jgi:hypothetical protein
MKNTGYTISMFNPCLSADQFNPFSRLIST